MIKKSKLYSISLYVIIVLLFLLKSFLVVSFDILIGNTMLTIVMIIVLTIILIREYNFIIDIIILCEYYSVFNLEIENFRTLIKMYLCEHKEEKFIQEYYDNDYNLNGIYLKKYRCENCGHIIFKYRGYRIFNNRKSRRKVDGENVS